MINNDIFSLNSLDSNLILTHIKTKCLHVKVNLTSKTEPDEPHQM